MQSSMQSMTQRGCNEISIYSGEPATKDQIKSEVKKLVAAFPEVTSDFIILLADRISDNNFTTQRVKDAINHIIDNSPYKRPAIADIISFDRKVKLFSFEEIQAKCAPGYPAFEHYERVTINNRVKYIEK
jgi:hypothetical protein